MLTRGVFVGQFDELPHVDTGTVANHGQLVGKGNLRVAAGILRQLAHLGRTGIGTVQLALHEGGVELDGLVGRGLIDATYYTVVVHQFVKGIARQHTLGTVGDEDLSLQFGTLAEDEFGHPLSGEHRRSRLDDKQVAGLQTGNDRTGSSLYVRDVRTVVLLEGRRHHDEKGVGLFGLGDSTQVSALHGLAHHPIQIGLHDMYFSLIDGFHYRGIDVHSYHLITMMGCYSRGGQANVTQSYKYNLFHIEYIFSSLS